ncbi:glycoside hydrolase family 44 protein [Hymenobacter sp. B81]|uniref:glycoside hydrolase family 44 protein n=1 Tax=Hymenobacter sp. B81 TaxID=3344878 RepID=UPI0037DCB758
MNARLRLILLAAWGQVASVPAWAQLPVNFTVNTAAAGRRPISPLIYGTNEPLSDADRYGSVRQGGNRLTGYNWENNASHAGSDYFYQNDNFLCGGLPRAGDCDVAGSAMSYFYTVAKSKGQAALVTLPLAGYVAADKSGTTVTTSQVAPSSRWRQVVFSKGSPFSLAPNLTDNFVYVDEEVNFLVNQHGTTANGGIAGYFLDNEPGLWPETHGRIHPAKPTMREYIMKSRDAALAVKAVDPSAELYGGVFYGFGDYFSLQDAPDYNDSIGNRFNNPYAWFVDCYLRNMRRASNAAGRRLLDVLDVHWYPEAIGDNRITEPYANTAADRQARMQAPRTLWDATYQENSWLGNEPFFRLNYLPIIPRLQRSIDDFYPGTKLSISEYAYGGNNDISGGIAHADALGIFGKYGVHNANWWKVFDPNNPNAPATYVSAGFRLYTNFDGQGSAFGNTAVTATTSNVTNTSIYAAITGGNEGRLTLVVLNKSNQAVQGSFTLTSGVTYTAGAAWGFDQNSAALSSRPAVTGLGNNRFSYTVPALSATILVLTAATPLPVVLSTFDGRQAEGQHLLRWTTASELDAAYFEVQRRGEREPVFRPLGQVPASNGSAPQRYSFRDVAPLAGTNYYRLHLVDRDGTGTTSGIVALRAEAAFTVEAFPNPLPAGRALRLQLRGTPPAGAQLRVVNALGQELLRRPLGSADEATSLVPEAAAWPAGVYVVEVSGPHGHVQRRRLLHH